MHLKIQIASYFHLLFMPLFLIYLFHIEFLYKELKAPSILDIVTKSCQAPIKVIWYEKIFLHLSSRMIAICCGDRFYYFFSSFFLIAQHQPVLTYKIYVWRIIINTLNQNSNLLCLTTCFDYFSLPGWLAWFVHVHYVSIHQ